LLNPGNLASLLAMLVGSSFCAEIDFSLLLWLYLRVIKNKMVNILPSTESFNVAVAPAVENIIEQSPIVAENLSKLEQAGEVGQHLIPTYMAALRLRPELQDVVLKPFDRADMDLPGTSGVATMPQDSPSGNPEVAFDVTGWDEYARLMQSRQVTVDTIAAMVGVKPGEVSPQLFAQFTLAHELGHIEDWRAKEFDFGRIDRAYEAELDTLPIPGVAAATIIAWATRNPVAADRYLTENQDQLQAKGIINVRQLVAAQEQGYRSIPSERVPDEFAAAVIMLLSMESEMAA
jgi:hypothetical protein